MVRGQQRSRRLRRGEHAAHVAAEYAQRFVAQHGVQLVRGLVQLGDLLDRQMPQMPHHQAQRTLLDRHGRVRERRGDGTQQRGRGAAIPVDRGVDPRQLDGDDARFRPGEHGLGHFGDRDGAEASRVVQFLERGLCELRGRSRPARGQRDVCREAGRDLVDGRLQAVGQPHEAAQIAGPVAAQEFRQAAVQQFVAIQRLFGGEDRQGAGPVVVAAGERGVVGCGGGGRVVGRGVPEFDADVGDFEQARDQFVQPGLRAQPVDQRRVVRRRAPPALLGEPLADVEPSVGVVTRDGRAAPHPTDHVAVAGRGRRAGPCRQAVDELPAPRVAARRQPAGQPAGQLALPVAVAVVEQEDQQDPAHLRLAPATVRLLPGGVAQHRAGQPVEGLGRIAGAEDAGDVKRRQLAVRRVVRGTVARSQRGAQFRSQGLELWADMRQFVGGCVGQPTQDLLRDPLRDERAQFGPLDAGGVLVELPRPRTPRHGHDCSGQSGRIVRLRASSTCKPAMRAAGRPTRAISRYRSSHDYHRLDAAGDRRSLGGAT